MGRASRIGKKAKTKDGIVFSSLPKSLLKNAKIARKAAGKEFEDINSDFYVNLCRSNIATRDGSVDARWLSIIDTYSMYCAGMGRWQSIYVNSEVVLDFLKNSDPRSSDGGAIKKSLRQNFPVQRYGYRAIAIHLPNTKHSILVHNISVSGYVFPGFLRDDDVGYTRIDKEGEWSKSHWDEGNRETWNIIFNLFLYMEAFSECVRDGVPELVTGAPDGMTQKTVSPAKEIEVEHRQSLATPHMRRGHFRMLQSERYTKKRGQIVYVKPTMVVGAAKTVEEPAA